MGIIPAMAFAAGIELLHAGLVLLLVQALTVAVDIARTNIPQMIIANSLGVGISVIIFHDMIKLEGRGTPK